MVEAGKLSRKTKEGNSLNTEIIRANSETWFLLQRFVPLVPSVENLKDVPAVDLGSLAIKSAIERADLKPSKLVKLSWVTSWCRPWTKRCTSNGVNAVLPVVSQHSINKVCGSGLKTVQLASNGIVCGDADIIMPVGLKTWAKLHMSFKPTLGRRMGDSQVVNIFVMAWRMPLDPSIWGTAENVAEQYGITWRPR